MLLGVIVSGLAARYCCISIPPGNANARTLTFEWRRRAGGSGDTPRARASQLETAIREYNNWGVRGRIYIMAYCDGTKWNVDNTSIYYIYMWSRGKFIRLLCAGRPLLDHSALHCTAGVMIYQKGLTILLYGLQRRFSASGYIGRSAALLLNNWGGLLVGISTDRAAHQQHMCGVYEKLFMNVRVRAVRYLLASITWRATRLNII